MASHDTIRAMLILDVIGRPAKHLTDTLEQIIAEMKKEKGVKVTDSRIKDPVPMKDNKEFFTTFSEIEVETEDMMYLAFLMFKYMPAHVEVISPEEIVLSNTGWSEILSELTRRLHSYDEVARVIQAERLALMKKVQELQGGITEKTEKAVKKATGKKVKKTKKKG